MSKLEEQKALPRRKLFKSFEEKTYLPIREPIAKPTRKPKKAKRK